MLTLTVEFLTGKSVATNRKNRQAAEFPQHPSRLFDALAATFFERVDDPDSRTLEEEAEHAALRWLEEQTGPSLREPEHVSIRSNTAVFVPVNDSSDGTSRIGEGYDLNRSRQERTFPTVVADPPEIVYCWSDISQEELEIHWDALDRLAANVTYLGHSSSLVRVKLGTEPIQPSLRLPKPAEMGDVRLRVPYSGRLAELSEQFQLSRRLHSRQEAAEFYAPFVRVRENGLPIARTTFDDRLLVFRPKDPETSTDPQKLYLSLTACLNLTTAVRKALMSLAPDPVSSVISGHQPNGEPLEESHLAILPLPFVDHRYADGELKGFALALPRCLWETDRQGDLMAVAQAVEKLTGSQITMGRSGVWELEAVTPETTSLQTLDAATWTKSSRVWASVTPIVFGRFPRPRSGGGKWMLHPETDDCVREMLGQLAIQDEHGQPITDCEVQVMNGSVFRGVPPSHHFPTLSTQGKPIFMEPTGRHRDRARWKPRRQKPPQGQRARWSAHVLLKFPVPVRGPLVIGAGRYLGLGLCKPYELKETQS